MKHKVFYIFFNERDFTEAIKDTIANSEARPDEMPAIIWEIAKKSSKNTGKSIEESLWYGNYPKPTDGGKYNYNHQGWKQRLG